VQRGHQRVDPLRVGGRSEARVEQHDGRSDRPRCGLRGHHIS
jgi:hypothetical protein